MLNPITKHRSWVLQSLAWYFKKGDMGGVGVGRHLHIELSSLLQGGKFSIKHEVQVPSKSQS